MRAAVAAAAAGLLGAAAAAAAKLALGASPLRGAGGWAILGKLLFGETWTPVWWVGLAMTLCGLFLLHTAAPRPAPLPAEKKET